MAEKPKLTVIEGGERSTSAWLDFPQTIAAKSPFDREITIRFRVSREDAGKAARAYRRQPIFDFWSTLDGKPPPVPNVDRPGNVPSAGLTCLIDAYACFRGIMRPLAEDDDGENVVVYILKPTFLYEYAADMVTVARLRQVPSGLVFAAYVRLDVSCEATSNGISGVLTHWHFVPSDSSGNLPSEHGSRYLERLW